MTYQYITRYDSPNYTRGRTRRIDGIVIHHWDDPRKKPQFEPVINWLCNPRARVSAHYVAEAGRVACLVNCKDTAWHAMKANSHTIGIECNPRQSDGDYQTIGELVADIRKTYGDLPLYPHRHFVNTDCPGTYDLARIDRIARGAKGGGVSAKPSRWRVAEDGHIGPDSTRAWQTLAGTPADGIISGQASVNRPYHVRIRSAQYGRGGSQLVRWIQKQTGAGVDGHMGPITIRAWQRFVGVAQDGYFGPATATTTQKWINNQLTARGL